MAISYTHYEVKTPNSSYGYVICHSQKSALKLAYEISLMSDFKILVCRCSYKGTDIIRYFVHGMEYELI